MWIKIHLKIRRAELHEALNNLNLLEFRDSQSSSLRVKKARRR
jgi:hypothetical protein